MRRLVHISFVFLLLGFALSGCRQSAAERRLVEIDTLIARGTYDSALAQLRAVDTAALSRDELAYHGLLMAHAAYKAYDSAYLDTTWITRARTAYADGGPYDRHIRTLLYSGCVAEDLGDPLTAMRWFKRTELEARPGDHYSRGFSLMAMGQIFQYQNVETDTAISKYSKALHEFRSRNGMERYELYCLSNLGQLFRLVNCDSAMRYITETLEKSISLKDTLTYFTAHEALAGLCNKNENFTESKHHALIVIKDGMSPYLHSCYYYAIQAYARLGDVDSAKLMFSSTPPPASFRDSVLFYRTSAILDSVIGNFDQAVVASEMASALAEKEFFERTKNNFSAQEYLQDSLIKQGEYKAHANRIRALLVVSIIILAVLVVLALRYRNKIKQLVNELKAERKTTKELHQAKELMRENLEKNNLIISELMNREQEANQQSLATAKLYKENINAVFQATVHVGKHKKSLFSYIDLGDWRIELDENQWSDILRYPPSAYPKAMQQISHMNPPLSENELKLLALDCLGIPNVVTAKLLGYADRSTITIRSRIADKLKIKGMPLQKGLDLIEQALSQN